MNYLNLAKEILEAVGGEENVSHAEHCSTRLRLSLIDKSKADVKKLESIKGVIGVVMNVQCQVVIGSDVSDVYDALLPLLDTSGEKRADDNGEKPKLGSQFLDFIISIFQPLVPAIAGGGILKSMLLLLNMIGILDSATPTYQILTYIGDAPLYFLPVLVTITTANKLKVNQLVAVAAVATMLTPGLSTMLAEGTTLFGIGLNNIDYTYQVFPAILCTIFYAQMERLFTKISPKVIKGFFVPMMALLITVPVTLIILGPMGYIFGQGFSEVIIFIFERFGWIAVAIMAACLPFMVAIGMHKAMIPYVVASLGETGKELIYLSASLAHNIAEGGAMLAVAVRTRDKDERSVAVSAGISALFGITEPALYSITIQKKRVLYGVMIGSFIGGAYVGIAGVEAYVAVGPGLASISMFISETMPNNIVHAIIGMVISFVASFVAVFVLWTHEDKKGEQNAIEADGVQIKSPVIGKVIDITKVEDEVFSNKIVGDGIAVIPSKGELYAPADGTVEMIFDTKHSLGMKTTDGVELLFHVGLETVNLKGKYFEPMVKVGDKVKTGDLLLKFDLDQIVAEGFDPVTIAVATNMNDFTVVPHERDFADVNDTVMTLAKAGN